jgi:rubrerythrin
VISLPDNQEFQEISMQYKYYPTYLYYPAKAYPNALQLMLDAVQSERADELFYDYLLRNAPDDKQKGIISSIRDDERKHNKMFREIYYQLTGEDIPPGQEVAFQGSPSYLAGLETSLFGELGAVEKYRQILFGLDFLPFRQMLCEIITDELKHSSKWNFLYTLNYCRIQKIDRF